jgi:small membrane protein
MIPFQFAGTFVCLLFAAWSLRRLVRRQRPRWLSLLGLLVGGVGAVTIVDPEITTDVARAVGIGRGVDLLTYLVALAFLGSWFYFYQRIRSLTIAVTAIVRELAIRNPHLPSPPGVPPDTGVGGPPAQPPDAA